ncbi:hypothetical protein N9S02_00535 [Alphaproteobacteria bacterium]|nr:hypothetical protein [Alphaproteobacteria bacterium]
MLILILKFVLNIFTNEVSNAIVFRFFNKLTKPIINFSTKLTPEFIVKPIVPLYLAWLVLMVRIYLLPLLVGHTYLGKFAFLFEKDLITLINSSILNIALYLNYGI